MDRTEHFIAAVAECEQVARTRGHSLRRWHRLSKSMHASIRLVCTKMIWVMQWGDGGIDGVVVQRLDKTVWRRIEGRRLWR